MVSNNCVRFVIWQMADVNLEAANPMRFAVYIIYAERL
jgi:hypothetical protein